MTAPSPLGLLLVSQGALADEVANTAAGILGARPAGLLTVRGGNGDTRADIEARVRRAVRRLAEPRGQVLILCDLFGATPANVARAVARDDPRVACCCGLNLAMLLEAVDCQNLPLDQAVPRVLAAGRRAVVNGDHPADCADSPAD